MHLRRQRRSFVTLHMKYLFFISQFDNISLEESKTVEKVGEFIS